MSDQKKLKSINWEKYLFEFLSVFFAVTFAFILNRWNENRKDNLTENKILTEIYNGLKRDSLDIVGDEFFYKLTFRGLNHFNQIVNGETVPNDSVVYFYHFITRDVITVQNRSGYEALKSQGLETIKNDSLRRKIIDLYEVTYELERKFNEEFDENKYMQSYFTQINNVVAPNFIYDSLGNITDIKLPIVLTEKEKNLVKSYLWKIRINKSDRARAAQNTKTKIADLISTIRNHIDIED